MEGRRFGCLVFIPGPGKGRYPHCNSLYVDAGSKAVIDPGSDEKVLRRIGEREKIDWIVNSHYHEDHVRFNFLFPDAGLCVHPHETPCYRSVRNLLDYYGLIGTEYEQVWQDLIVRHFHYRERIPSREMRDGDVLDFGGTAMQVIHTPGHSIGHCSFYFPEEGLLYLGDLDMTSFGPWYGDRVSDIDDTIASVRKLMGIPARFYVSSHETGVMEGDISPKAEAYLAVIAEREEKLLRFLKEPRTLEEMVNQWIVYRKPREPKYFFEFGERALIKKHLERLEKKKMLKRDGNRYFVG